MKMLTFALLAGAAGTVVIGCGNNGGEDLFSGAAAAGGVGGAAGVGGRSGADAAGGAGASDQSDAPLDAASEGEDEGNSDDGGGHYPLWRIHQHRH